MIFVFCITFLLLSSMEVYGFRHTNRQDNVPFSTPSPKNLPDMVPKDANDFQNQHKDEYHVDPANKQELDNMLAYSENLIANAYTDVINQTSQQFEVIKAKQEMKVQEENRKDVNILREGDQEKRQKNAMDRAAALMTQFVYGARYKLQYGQNLRNKYSDKPEYRLGYSFALMRDIKQQQLHLYSTMDLNYKMYLNKKAHPKNYTLPESYVKIDSYIAMYEKIVRLHLDLLDVIALAKELAVVAEEEKRKTTTAQ